MIEPDAGRPRIRVAQPALPPLASYVETLEGVWGRGMLSNDGPCARSFEQAFAAYSRSTGHVLAASSCDLALTLLVAALELPRGARAVLPSFGFPSTVHALEWNGLRPEFVDVDTDDWCLHPEQLDGRLDGVSLILATHMFGVPCDVAGLQALAGSERIVLLFDAAQAVGTWVGDRHVSEFGDASVISFSATKVTTAAEGAIAVLHHEQAAERLRQLRNYGMDAHGASGHRGLNAKMSEPHAALGVLTLAEIEQQIALRQGLIDRYRRALASRRDLVLQVLPAGSRPTPAMFVVELGGARDRVREALGARGIEARPYFPALHLMARLAELPRSELPVTERLGAGLLALPLYSELEPAVVDEVCEVLCETLDGLHSVEGK